MAQITATEEDIQQVKDIIYRLENILIQRKQFLDSQGTPSFITVDLIRNESTLSEAQVNQILRNLHRDEFMVFDVSHLTVT